MTLNLVSVLYLAALTQALLFVGLVWKRNAQPQQALLLSGALGVVIYWLLSGFTVHSGLYRDLPHLQGWMPAAPWLLGPFIYGYARRLIAPKSFPLRRLVPHLLPAAIVTALAMPGVLTSGAAKVAHIDMMAMPHAHTALMVVMMLAAKVQMATYLVLSWRLMAGAQRMSGKSAAPAFGWQKRLCLVLITAEAVWSLLFLFHLSTGLIDFLAVTRHWALFLSAAVLALAYWGLQVPPELSHLSAAKKEAEKYGRAALPATTAGEVAALITCSLQDEQLYLQPDLTLGRLSDHLALSRHVVSQVINESLGTSFYALVNGYRVAHAKNLMADPSLHHSIERLAAECGFNNRVTFNKAFKDIEGMSPSTYRRSQTLQPVRA